MKKILIVEDDPAIAALLLDFLTEPGYEAVTARDGVEALTLFSAQNSDLILLEGMLYQVGRYRDRDAYLAHSLENTSVHIPADALPRLFDAF